jgi:hypothetical protein
MFRVGGEYSLLVQAQWMLVGEDLIIKASSGPK